LHYRTIKIPFFAPYYFKVWRFIPNGIDTFSKGKYLRQEDCPTLFTLKFYIRKRNRKKFKNYYVLELDNAELFENEYLNIETYFEKVRASRKEYLEKKRQNATKSKI
jgi:hypothetical protein